MWRTDSEIFKEDAAPFAKRNTEGDVVLLMLVRHHVAEHLHIGSFLMRTILILEGSVILSQLIWGMEQHFLESESQ